MTVTTATPAPASNGSSGGTQAPAQPAGPKDATGPQTPGPNRDASGKFTSPNGAAKPPVDDDPEVDFGEYGKLKRSAAMRELARARTSSKVLTEAQQAKAEAQRLTSEWKTKLQRAKESGSLDAILADLGLDAEQEQQALAKSLYAKHIEPKQLTEEQRQLRDAQAKLKAFEDEKKAATEKAEAKQKKAALDADAKKLEAEVMEAAKAGRIPSSPTAMRRILARALAFEEKGLNLPLEQVTAIVREEVAKDVGDFVTATPVADRKALWGDEVWKAEVKAWTATPIAERKALFGLQTFKTEAAAWYAYFEGLLGKAPMASVPVRAPAQKDATAKREERLTPQQWLDRQSRRK